MCDTPPGDKPDVPLTHSEIIDLVLEDRAELVLFRPVGELADSVTRKAQALNGWRLQLALIARNADDPLVKVAAVEASERPGEDSIRQLIQLTNGSVWSSAVHHVLAELSIAHIHEIFGGDHGR